MKKMFFLAATAALALSSCSSDDLVQVQDPEVLAQDGAVSFSAYSGRQNRATADDLDALNALKVKGFGVFGYEQGTTPFATYMTTNVTPNFMYNQLVSFGDVTEYKVKEQITKAVFDGLNVTYQGYFTVNTGDDNFFDRNDTGEGITVNTTQFESLGSAEAKALDPQFSGEKWTYDPVKYWVNNPGAKHSFFAYAPYDPALSSATGASPRLILNSKYGGPALEYTFDQTNGTDILCAPAFTDMEKPKYANIVTETEYTEKTNNGTMKFQFSHALSKATFNLQTFVDQKTDGQGSALHGNATTPVDANTKVIVKSIKLKGKFATKGFLKLIDGTWDTSSAVDTDIELISTPITLKGDGSEETFDQLTNILFFPLTDTAPADKFQIIITYDVATDANGDGDYDDLNDSKITNVITSEGSYPLAQNTAYEYHLNLGLETVRFSATVTDWEDGHKTEVDLPANK